MDNVNDYLPAAIDKAYEREAEAETYVKGKAIGAGSVGGKCLREILMKFRRFDRSHTFPGRMLRLFGRGHREEPQFVEMLERLGARVMETDRETGKQFKIKFADGHGTGFLDGIALNISGWLLGTDEDEPVLLEFKTYAEKRFKAVQKDGVKKTDSKYWAQPILYMDDYKINYCLFCAVNKNTDELYFELIKADADLADTYRTRARMLVHMQTLPPRVGNNMPTWHECRFCDVKEVCHSNKLPESTCRSCAFSTVRENQKITCDYPGADKRDLTPEQQILGCPGHAFNPGFIESSHLQHMHELNTETHVAYVVRDNGTVLFNGAPVEGHDESEGRIVSSVDLEQVAAEVYNNG